jgi:hypothetical protein
MRTCHAQSLNRFQNPDEGASLLLRCSVMLLHHHQVKMAHMIVIGVELWNRFCLHGLLACPSAAQSVVFKYSQSVVACVQIITSDRGSQMVHSGEQTLALRSPAVSSIGPNVSSDRILDGWQEMAHVE